MQAQPLLSGAFSRHLPHVRRCEGQARGPMRAGDATQPMGHAGPPSHDRAIRSHPTRQARRTACPNRGQAHRGAGAPRRDRRGRPDRGPAPRSRRVLRDRRPLRASPAGARLPCRTGPRPGAGRAPGRAAQGLSGAAVCFAATLCAWHLGIPPHRLHDEPRARQAAGAPARSAGTRPVEAGLPLSICVPGPDPGRQPRHPRGRRQRPGRVPLRPASHASPDRAREGFDYSDVAAIMTCPRHRVLAAHRARARLRAALTETRSRLGRPRRAEEES